MKLFDKLKEKLGITPKVEVEAEYFFLYTIKYTNVLNPAQETQLANHMINHFNFQCSPSSITVNPQGVQVKMTSACLTGEGLKKVSDDTLGEQLKAEVESIQLDGNVIWSKPQVFLGW